MASGTIFLDVKSDNTTSVRYTFTKAINTKSFINVKKEECSEDGFEMYTHTYVELIPNYSDKTLKIKPKPIKPGGLVRLDIHRLTMLVWSDDFLKQIKHYEVYFNKKNPDVPIIFGYVTSDNKKSYCSFKTIFESSDIFMFDSRNQFSSTELSARLKSEDAKVGDVTFKINETKFYQDIKLTHTGVFSKYKQYTHTTNRYFKSSKIQLDDRRKFDSFNESSYPSLLLIALHIYFYEADYDNINPFLFQFETQLAGGGKVNYDYYELYDVDKSDSDSTKWVKKYRKRGKSDIQNTEELLNEIYTKIFGSNKAGAIAGGVTTTVILGGGGMAGGIAYYKYPQLVLSLISKLIPK